MIIVNFIGNEVEKYIRGLDQYDRGQILCISGLDLPKFVEVQFSLQETGGLAERIVGITTDGVTEVEIPNYMLTNNDATSDYEIYAFVYVTNETSAETVYKITMEVNSRSKPNPYDTPEDIGMFNRVIEVMKDSVTAAENAAGTSEKNAQKTGEDRKAIEEMVGTITGIEQQVQDVKEYAGQAKTAAENALLSEQESKKSEEASLQHRTGAETAENNAELAESNAKKSEQAVERAKQLVMQMGQEVLDNKNYVDGKVEEFGQTVTNANNSIGTKKTESLSAIKTAKTGAVGAVETAGTEQTKKVADEGTKQVKAVEDKGNEVLQSIPEDFTTQMESKLNKQQGVENKGKALVVGEDGNVTVGEVQGGDGIPIINTMSGESHLVVPDSAERVNKGFSIIGNTTQNQDPPPSPDNLQEIKNVGKWNPETQKYEVGVRVTGNNILNTQIEPDTKGIYQGWKVGDGKKKITLSIIDKVNNKDISDCYFGLSGNGTDQKDGVVWCIENGKIAKTKITSLNPYVTIFPSDETAQRKILERFDIQCEFGEIKTEYQPYKEQTLTLTSDRPLTKWDRLVEQDAQIGWLYKSQIIDRLDGKSNKVSPGGKKGEVQHFSIEFKNTPKGNGNTDIYVDKYRAVPSSYALEEFGICCNWNDGIKYFSAPNINITNTEEFKAWLSENPLTLEYETETPEFVPLQKEEQDAIRNIKTYYPTTVITVDGGEVIPSVELTYTADTKNFILNREKAMQAQMLNIQSALISRKISGGGIKITDSSRLPVEEFSMSGKTEQNGTPTPTNPVNIEVTPQGIITVDFTDGTNHQIVELNCPREFTKWDRLEKIDGTWNWVFKAIKDTDVKQSRFDLFGWNHATQYKDFKNGVYAYAWSFKNKEKGWQTSICKQFKNENGSYDKGILWHYSDNPAMDRQYFVTNHKTSEEFEAWVEANPLTMYFEGKETEYVPLLQEEQDKLNALTMYAPNTEATNTGGCNMELTYTVDTKSYVDAKILTLSKALL